MAAFPKVAVNMVFQRRHAAPIVGFQHRLDRCGVTTDAPEAGMGLTRASYGVLWPLRSWLPPIVGKQALAHCAGANVTLAAFKAEAGMQPPEAIHEHTKLITIKIIQVLYS